MKSSAEILAQLKVLLQNPTGITRESLQALLMEVFEVVFKLRSEAELTKTPEVRQQALAEIESLKKKLEAGVNFVMQTQK